MLQAVECIMHFQLVMTCMQHCLIVQKATNDSIFAIYFAFLGIEFA